MPTYRVVAIVDATVTCTIDAETPEEAVLLADLGNPGLCHQCGKTLTCGDVVDVTVLDPITDDTLLPFDRDARSALRDARIAQLQALVLQLSGDG